ncbi:Eco57I restriction-modification methylase domain-containing protein [Paenibacillus silvestris]|nr:Eco57I restriction-modification methylase domain-containing protein [Paenibacillus silvestris]
MKKLITKLNVSRKMESIRNKATCGLDEKNKSLYEQYFTNYKTARLMSSMMRSVNLDEIRILDPGAGIGILTTALIAKICSKKVLPKKITVFLYEIDNTLEQFLYESMEICTSICNEVNVGFEFNIILEDFISVLDNEQNKFNIIIMNPPYKKISRNSEINKRLSKNGINVTNYYAAFMAIAKGMLQPKGQLIGITPRSFCNGRYYTEFRLDFLSEMRFTWIHLYNSRNSVFSEDGVLQETIVFHCYKDDSKTRYIRITSSESENLSKIRSAKIPYFKVISPEDPQKNIYITRNDLEQKNREKIEYLSNTLEDIGISVSTGKVVDFREPPDCLSKKNHFNGIPIIYPDHFTNMSIVWPRLNIKKYNYIKINDKNINRILPSGNYVLIKRLTSKEEKRRLVSAVYEGQKFSEEGVAFENKLNYFHVNKKGLQITLARGLSLYLNSSYADNYFRLFSGTTQVNVNDLKNFKYPSLEQLLNIGSEYSGEIDQSEIDMIIKKYCFF